MEQTDVMIVGAGPTGLTLGCALRAAGVDVTVVDRLAQGANTSRAAVIHARTLDVLEDLGLSHRLVAAGLVVPRFTVRDRDRALAALDFSLLPSVFPFTLMLPQSDTEAILEARLGELGGVVQRPCDVVSVERHDSGARCVLRSPDGGERTVDARFVVGADGLHGIVRPAAGIGVTGGRYDAAFVLADVEMTWPLPGREVQLFLSPAGLVVVAPLPGGRYRVVATMEAAPEHASSSDVQAVLDARGPGGARVREVAWSSRFRVQHHVADTYRAGSLLLAGDAAHVHSPAGGQGMNTGIQDAVDLAGALAAVLRDGAAEATLDGYERRRRPVAQRVVALTDRLTRAATVRGPGPRLVRNTAIAVGGRVPLVRRRLTARIAGMPGR